MAVLLPWLHHAPAKPARQCPAGGPTHLAAADEARKATSLLGFWIVFIMLVTGVACWWAGTLGGHHRDEGTLY